MLGDLLWFRVYTSKPNPESSAVCFPCEQSADEVTAGPALSLSFSCASSLTGLNSPAHAIELTSSNVCHVLTSLWWHKTKGPPCKNKICLFQWFSYAYIPTACSSSVSWLFVHQLTESVYFNFPLKRFFFSMAILVSRNLRFRCLDFSQSHNMPVWWLFLFMFTQRNKAQIF